MLGARIGAMLGYRVGAVLGTWSGVGRGAGCGDAGELKAEAPGCIFGARVRIPPGVGSGAALGAGCGGRAAAPLSVEVVSHDGAGAGAAPEDGSGGVGGGWRGEVMQFVVKYSWGQTVCGHRHWH